MRATLTATTTNSQEQAVKDDVEYLKQEELIASETSVSGWIYDVNTGGLSRVAWLGACFDKHGNAYVAFNIIDLVEIQVFLKLDFG